MRFTQTKAVFLQIERPQAVVFAGEFYERRHASSG
jgi:hypothetical protein